MLFANLGTYSLWDDESETALGAQGVLATGDTTAIVGHNIDARRGGVTLRNLSDRLTPPLPTYLTALSFKLGRQDAFFARLPFVLMGLAGVAIMLGYLLRIGVSVPIMVSFVIALLGNVSYFLYFRQDRYYGAALFLGILLAALYLGGLRKTRERLLYSVASFLLFFSHPIICVQMQAIVAFDWFVFERNRRGLPTLRELLELALPCMILAAPFLFVWNPLLVKSRQYLDHVTLGDRLTLLWWNARDLFRGEFIPWITLCLAPIAYWRTRNRDILRALAAIAVVVTITSLVTYQDVSVTSFADIRYEILAIVAGLMLSVTVFTTLFDQARVAGIIVMTLLLWTNIGTGKILTDGCVESHPLQFAHELSAPCEEPYTPAAQWIVKNVPKGSSVLAYPDYMMYPLMFHAPNAVYAWQLDPNQKEEIQFNKLAKIHFKGEELPEYIVIFGPIIANFKDIFAQWRSMGFNYEQVARLNVFWKDLYRPEIFWRTFKTIKCTNPDANSINIYKLKK